MREPLWTYCSTILTRPSLKMTTRCHCVRSLRSPVALSRQDSEVAIESEATLAPDWLARTSGSLPRKPTMMALLTLLMIPSPRREAEKKEECSDDQQAPLCSGHWPLPWLRRHSAMNPAAV